MTAMTAPLLPLHGEAEAPHALLLQRVLNPLPDFHLLSQSSPGRAVAEEFVSERYQASYGAQVTHFLSWMMTLQCRGQVSATAGLQPASSGPLYLERYLDAPVERLLSTATGSVVKRNSIVEVGNLAASRRGASHLLFLMFSSVLHNAGYEWIVFTATHALRNNLQKLEFNFTELQPVDVAALPEAVLEEWGSYYSTTPIVMAGRLQDAVDLIDSKALYRRVASLYRTSIDEMARQIRR